MAGRGGGESAKRNIGKHKVRMKTLEKIEREMVKQR